MAFVFISGQDVTPQTFGWHRSSGGLDGCRRFVEPVSPRLCIKTILWSEGIDEANVKPRF
jgi:hypothetical protein